MSQNKFTVEQAKYIEQHLTVAREALMRLHFPDVELPADIRDWAYDQQLNLLEDAEELTGIDADFLNGETATPKTGVGT